MRILALHDGGSGCSWYRIFTPLEELAKQTGWSIRFLAVTNNIPITLSSMEGYDVIVGQRFTSHRGLETWRRARTPFSRLVYETDDDVFSVSPENWAAFHLYGRGDVQDAVIHAAEVSDLITVTTPYLAGVMHEHTKNSSIAVLPNSIPDWVLQIQPHHRDRPCVGWQGGASHGMDVGLVAGPVRRFLKRFPDWDFQLNGTDYRPTIKHDRAQFSSWIPIAEDPAGYFSSIDFDIGLAPLVNSEFSRSKSDIKVLEYAALGIPSIASDSVVYRNFIEHGVNGFLVHEEYEWLKYMSILANDSALREKMGAAAKEAARKRTIENTWSLWKQEYEGLFRGKAE